MLLMRVQLHADIEVYGFDVLAVARGFEGGP